MRKIVPDKMQISIGADVAAFVGIGYTPINFTMLTMGTPSISFTPTVSAYAGVGGFLSGCVVFTVGNFTGNPHIISSNMLTGETYGFVGTRGILANVLLGASYSPAGNNGFINGSVGIGIGGGAFGGIQFQETFDSIRLW